MAAGKHKRLRGAIAGCAVFHLRQRQLRCVNRRRTRAIPTPAPENAREIAREIAPAQHTYSGGATDPARWACWTPRQGDVLVCTPPKCGTTWTQSILSMLVHGTTDLPAAVPVLSPWIDADLGVSAEMVKAAVTAQTGRRVLKTHTPSDGFPVWEGVTVIAVYRHPLDVFFSLRKHVANMVKPFPGDDFLLEPVPQSLDRFLSLDIARDDFGHDGLAKIALHYTQTACIDRGMDLHVLHYTDMVRDGHAAVTRLAEAIGIDDADLIERVAQATSFSSMKSNAERYAPVAGTGFWTSDAGFFDSASSNKWEGQISDADLARFEERLEELVPDARARDWFKSGDAARP